MSRSTSRPRFPSACGKTNLAMLQPTIPGWTVETVGDDICWMRFGDDGRLYAINPEAGFFGVAPGTGEDTNANAVKTFWGNSIFTNVALHRRRRRVVGGPHRRAARAPDRLEGQRLDAGSPRRPRPTPTRASPRRPGSARRSRRSGRTPRACRSSAILFGGRRATAVPLVTESFDWQHGVFLGSTVSSETTAAAAGAIGQLRRDPFAMLPFCGYNMGDYVGPLARDRRGHHRRQAAAHLLRQLVPQGRRTASGCGRASARTAACSSGSSTGSRARAEGVETPIGILPSRDALDLDGLDIPAEDLDLLLVGRRRDLEAGGRAASPSSSSSSATTCPSSSARSTPPWSTASTADFPAHDEGRAPGGGAAFVVSSQVRCSGR